MTNRQKFTEAFGYEIMWRDTGEPVPGHCKILIAESEQFDEWLQKEYEPSAHPGWIPCRTALPKEDGQYIVTVKYEHVDGYEDIYSEHGEWVDGHWDAGFGYYHCGMVEKVLAWMPLPTPYREGGQDNG